MQRFTSSQVEALTLRELTDAYNIIAESPIKKFKDKPTGVRRLLDALKAVGLLSDGIVSKVKGKSGGGNGTRRTTFNFEPMESIREIRTGTKREKVITMLRKGATIQQVQNSIGWDARTAREGIKLIHTYVGYGLAEDDQGIISLVE